MPTMEQGDTWYALPADGEELSFPTPFGAHAALTRLNKAGTVEKYSAATKLRDVVAERHADGRWTQPDDEGDQ